MYLPHLAPRDSAPLALGLTYPTDIANLPKNLEYIFIHQTNISRFKNDLEKLNLRYHVVITHVSDYLDLQSLKTAGWRNTL